MSETMAIEALHGDRALHVLRDVSAYKPSTWNIADEVETEKRAYWIGLFREHFPSLIAQSMREAEHAGRDLAEHRAACDAAEAKFEVYLQELEAGVVEKDHYGVLDICFVRERVLRECGLPDPYRLAKHEQNEHALEVLPEVLKEHDSLDEVALCQAVIEGVFAGNIFDMGAVKTSGMFADGGKVCFHDTRGKLKPRPWLYDDFDAWQKRMTEGEGYQAALVFVDNAGPDVVLGMIPFCRYLLMHDVKVIMAANSGAALNDVTVEELDELVDAICDVDEVICEAVEEGRLQVVGSGNVAPLIDLTKVSGELVEIAEQEGVDLVVLEGMGRAVESNFEARFDCDSLKIAMLKDKGSADGVGGEVYDLVMRYRSAGE
ncbi:ARMT1-like domain-containing protein [Poriferisphaera sp. WC338]|uniref:ARMT1-like domain-containing protein n=1 Tax=Poriferisphaera sp. WC338 TaxID=3425129 RepID=UPI003D8135D2